ncbi:uncharacterized protein LY89DRAFT_599335, partial [Mollisia scopiformis]
LEMVSFQDLPSIALLHICDYLDRDHASSLVAFACANKHCYSTAIILLFRSIRLSTSSQLAAEVQRCHDMLHRSASTGFVRRLSIDGPWPQRNRDGIEQTRPKIFGEDRGYERRLIDTVSTYRTIADKTSAMAVYEANDAWKPLAALVRQLPALQDLIYKRPSQFQPCLLETLHQHLPHCRLHIDPFKLRSLNEHLTDPYEVVLATSPSLYSIGVDCDMQWGAITGTVQNFNYEAVQSMVACLAPNLKEIRIFNASWGATLNGFPEGEPWKGFTPNRRAEISSTKIGSLRSLCIGVGDKLIGTHLIKTWNAHTDFSVLESMNLEAEVDQAVLEFLAASSGFPSLTDLVLNLTYDYMSPSQKTELYNLASRFLLSLQPLSRLTLSGGLSRVSLESILEHHGAALRSLDLKGSPESDKILSPEVIARIGPQCPLLRDLTLKVRRSKGDAIEWAARGGLGSYQALGSFVNLKYLSLALDASNHAILGAESLAGLDLEDDDVPYPETPTDPSFDEFDQRFFQESYSGYRAPRKGHIRDAFINSAVDGVLTEAIFWAISCGKAEGSLPLEELRLRVFGGGDFGGGLFPQSVSVIIAELGRSWFCKRCVRDDRRQQLITKELTQRKQETWQTQTGQPTPFAQSIFRRIWPARGGDWRDEWCSLTLQTLNT